MANDPSSADGPIEAIHGILAGLSPILRGLATPQFDDLLAEVGATVEQASARPIYQGGLLKVRDALAREKARRQDSEGEAASAIDPTSAD
jgi:hypothetical protein